MSRETTTKHAYPLAVEAIKKKRYRIEYSDTPSTKSKDRRHKFIVMVGDLPAFECGGGGLALSWIQDKETERIRAASERRVAKGAPQK